MTPRDALGELGLDDGATNDDIRRAYLRLLKTRKPEVDPQGFQRLREAYDVAKARAAFRPIFTMPTAREDGPAEHADAVYVEPPTAPLAPPPAPSLDPEQTAPLAPTPDPPADAQSEIAADAPVEPLPLSPLAKAYEEYRAKRWRAAAVQMTAALDAARRDPSVAVPAAGVVIETMLRLHARGNERAIAASLALERAFKAWMHVLGIEAQILSGHLAVSWAMLRDLAILPPETAREVRSAIAKATLDGDLDDAREALHAHAANEPAAAAKLARFMRTNTPALARTFAPLLVAVQPTSPTKRSSTWWPWWTVGVVVVNLARAFTSMSPSTPPPRKPMPSETRRALVMSVDEALKRDAGVGTDGGTR